MFSSDFLYPRKSFKTMGPIHKSSENQRRLSAVTVLEMRKAQAANHCDCPQDSHSWCQPTFFLIFLGKVLFYTVSAAYLLMLVLLRRLTNLSSIMINVRGHCLRSATSLFNNWLRRLWQLTRHPKLFYPFIVFHINLMFGPWFIGYVLHDNIGVMFVWGLIVKGTLIKDGITHIYGLFHLITFSIPALFYISYCLDYFHYSAGRKHHPKRSICHQIRHIYIPFLALLIIQLLVTFTEFPKAYGTTAVILGPVRTGSIVLFTAFHFLVCRSRSMVLEPNS